jgi:uncharacterized damage-inducible protein DinB
MTGAMDTAIGRAYIEYSRRRLTLEYLPRILKCLEELSDEDIWWRAHETDNSIGNLLLHLSGNIRQWIMCGLGGAPDTRNRSSEFSERKLIPRAELLAIFSSTIHEADAVLGAFDTSRLLEKLHIQVYDVTCLDAISHVVEHVAQHMGQIIYITKLRRGIDLQFFRL